MSKNKPLPKDHPLHHASKELIAAIDFYERMHRNHLAEFAAFESDWREFLQKIERVWNKIQAAVCQYPGWRKIESEINRLRSEDPLLSYLRHARNADEHSIQNVASDWDGRLRASQIGATSVRVEWDPWDRPLLPVKNRGVLYQPPREHLGMDFTDRLKKGTAEPIVVADLALHFYKNLLDRVNRELLLRRGAA
jgi:hypothetical protein